jgi:hypothetical protein
MSLFRERHVRHPEALGNLDDWRRPHEFVECIASKIVPMSDGRFLRRAGGIDRLQRKKAFRGNPLRFLGGAKMRCAEGQLIGGLALASHKVIRATQDIDLLTDPTGRDPFEALDDLMTVIEALCPVWPHREIFSSTDRFLL